MVKFSDLPLTQPPFTIRFVTNQVYNIKLNEVKTSPIEEHGLFEWSISTGRAKTGDLDQDFLTFWLNFKPLAQFMVNDSILTHYALMMFKIVPYDRSYGSKGKVHKKPPLELGYSALEMINSQRTSKNSQGWFDFAPFSQVFDPENGIVSPDRTLTLEVAVTIRADIRLIPPFSKASLNYPSICRSDEQRSLSQLFGQKDQSVAIFLYNRESNGKYQELPLHFHDERLRQPNTSEQACLLKCLEERIPEDIDPLQAQQLNQCQTIYQTKVYTLREGFHNGAFMAAVRYIYKRELILLDCDSLAAPLYHLASECNLLAISKACLYAALTPKNACQLLPLILQRGSDEDEPFLVNAIRDEASLEEVFKQPAFFDLDVTSLQYLFKLENLEGSEDLLASALNAWTKKQIKKTHEDQSEPTMEEVRTYLHQNGLFELIRHTLLEKPEEFLSEEDNQWLNYAKTPSKLIKQHGFNFSSLKHKRKGEAMLFPRSPFE